MFDEQASATAALRGLNDTQFYNRDMVSHFDVLLLIIAGVVS